MNSIKSIFKRYYTKELEKDSSKTVYDLFNWKKVNVILKDYKTNKVLVDMKNLEFPESYSQNACDIIASKYFRKSGVPNNVGYENSMKMVAHRLVNFWLQALRDEKLIQTKEDAKIFYDEMVYGLLNQMYAPNSPQWFNTGLALSYNIKGSKQGSYYFDEKEKKVVESDDSYSRTQASACFILSIQDKLLGDHSISEQYVTETKLFKGGSGTGTNFSTIRAIGEPLSGGGVSSGLMSFLKGLDRNAGAIKSGGTTRRAAKMLCLDIDHPEIMDFITWKAKEENKVRNLGKMGYDTSFEGEAYETVSGQNGNNSVRFSDEFMKKVENLNINPNETIELKGRVSNNINKSIKVSKLWNTFNEAAWECADPAPQFDDIFNTWHTCPCGEDGNFNTSHNRINSTNPCGEYAFLDDTSCNLASINIYKFFDINTKEFDVDGYLHIIGLIQLALEASIHWGQFPTEDIARKTYLFRTTGLGISNLASLLMSIGYPYDSEHARNLVSALVGILTGYSYYISSLMAAEIGCFPKYEINKEHMLRVIRNHARTAGADNTSYENLNYEPVIINHNLLEINKFDKLSNTLKEVWDKALKSGKDYGYRNAQVSVIAPTGTISLAMDCGATSIEPFFSHVTYKKLSGGSFMTIVNPVLEVSLQNLGYSNEEIKDIVEYIMRKETITENGFEYEKIIDGKIEGAPHLKKEHLAIFDTANRCGSGMRFISPMGHVKLVASITPLISGAVSKTVNLPKSATVEDFKNVVLSSWKLGVKGISLYRDSSKVSQPLNISLAEDQKTQLEDLTYNELLQNAKELQAKHHYSRRDKLIGIRRGTTHPAQIEDVKIYTTVNRNDKGEISEIYITTDREGTIITGLLNSLSKSISVMLQYHVPPEDISKMLRGQKYEPYGFVKKHPFIKSVTSISDLISKIIDIELDDFSRCQIKPDKYNHINESIAIDSPPQSQKTIGERLYDSICPTCSSTRMVRNGTCKICLDCGSTTGCS
ncbi:vitamin B12-dependent ribonucleotide reductase [Clostridium ganghwense]|uniref:Vitamin B12-dependent ribonucleotide reductase n=1 Tax=Clostridium ganghwense TaxID=312089 RepID=A0ABT4CS83_9CLOT|nr:vitamin B12-dependent ribonucleotide reductase [Clostridium ganghwense]MCY6371907.1 vitamin B12-dependent ribonucleotide reductase [Clostridium ganghwense]